MTKVTALEAAFDPEIAAAENVLARYVAAFERAYGPLADELIAFPCRDAEHVLQSDAVILRGAQGANLLLRGPSGCGKTLLAYRIALDSARQGRVPIVVQAKDFTGSLRAVANQEVVLLDVTSVERLIQACRRLDRPLVLLVDGYNECAEAFRVRLTRGVAAASRRLLASVIVTAQALPDRPELLDLNDIRIPESDLATKCAIARKVSATDAIEPSLESLIGSVGSGLEARLVGEVGRELPAGASRFALFDAFLRRRMGVQATAGIRALAHIAGLLLDRISFGLSVRDLDRLAEQEQIAPDILHSLQDARLLAMRGDRASFGHELYLNAFSAEAIVRRAQGRAEAITSALRLPQSADRKALILGAIDDHTLLLDVLGRTSDVQVIQSCLGGQCGQAARLWAERRYGKVLRRAHEELRQVRFELSDEGFMNVRAEESSLLNWTGQDRAILHVLPQLAAETARLDEILALAAALDHRLAQEFSRLRDQARAQKVALRSGLFANNYVWGGDQKPAAASVFTPIHSGALFRSTSAALAATIRERLAREDLTPGQLYLLLALHRSVGLGEASLVPILPNLLRRYWASAAYHLRLDLMHSVHYSAWKASEAERRELIDAIQVLPPPQAVGVSSTMIDALKALGALDDSENDHLETVRSNIRDALASPADPDMQGLAFGVWYGQFDHPYDGAYCQAVTELEPSEKKALLRMAAQGADQDSSFVGVLIQELMAFGDPDLAPLIVRWTDLPPTRCVFPQDAVGAFVLSHIALGRLACPLPSPAGADPLDPAGALIACGHILYWLNRADIPKAQRLEGCAAPLALLGRPECTAAVSIIREFSRERSLWMEGLERLAGPEPVQTRLEMAFPIEVAVICRQCLRNPEPQRGYFDFRDLSGQVFDFAIDVLAEYGHVADLPLLQAWSHHARVGKTALAAIARLEEAQAIPASA